MKSSGMATIHTAARQGFANRAGTYARIRPSYGEDTLDALDSLLGQRPGHIADVGAGTGALSTLLAARGHSVLALEPVAAMLARCGEGPIRVRATANALPIRTGALKAITVATAFHWFSTREVLDEFRRCVQPSGTLVLMWNDRDLRVPWVRRHTELVDAYQGDTPRFRQMRWREVIDAHDGWREVAHLARRNPSPITRKGLIDRIFSTSFIGALGPEEAEKVHAEAESLVTGLPEEFDYPYITRIWAYRPV
ncbi:MAG: class I SAM-dependent methyltransferase [Acidimicrobiaceae bacterium]|nr:class I SAM-dependent methyltransferase [Acidimicrobiaceae bacterium]